jgi:hypothetical protein
MAAQLGSKRGGGLVLLATGMLACSHRSALTTTAEKDAGPLLDALADRGPDASPEESWRVVPAPVADGRALNSVWAAAPDDAWAVGEAGAILHFDGATWSSAMSGMSRTLTGVAGRAPDDVWIVGVQGLLLEWDAREQWWTPVASGSSLPLAAVAAGFDGSVGTFAAVGAGGTLVLNDGVTAGFVTKYVTDRALAGVSAGTPSFGFAVGEGGTIVAGAADGRTLQASPTTRNLRAVFGRVIVGDGGTILRLAANGVDWMPDASGTTRDLAGVWGASDDDVWAVGAGGTILHWDGAVWSPVPSGTTADLRGVWGIATRDVWAVGAGGTILHRGSAQADSGVYPVAGRCPMEGASENDAGLCVCTAEALTMCEGACVDVQTAHDDCGGCRRACLPEQNCSAGQCMCPAGLRSCAHACVDVRADDASCGDCGLSCDSTATCRDGLCGPPSGIAVEADPGCGALDLAIAGGVLYTADRDHGVVRAQSLEMAAPVTTIATGEPRPAVITPAGSTLYWITSSPASGADGGTSTTGTIRRVALPDGPPADLVSETNDSGGIRGLAVSPDGARVFYSAGHSVKVIPATGGSAVEVVHEEQGDVPAALALEGDRLAFTTDFNNSVDVATIVDGAVARCAPPTDRDPMGGSPPVNCARLKCGGSPLLLTPIALREGVVYWAEPGSLSWAPVDQLCNSESLFLNDLVTGFALGGDTVYISTYDDSGPGTGTILRAPLGSTGPLVRLARGQNAPSAIALDAVDVFWATGDCRVASVSR